jgi:hypothetical protein
LHDREHESGGGDQRDRRGRGAMIAMGIAAAAPTAVPIAFPKIRSRLPISTYRARSRIGSGTCRTAPRVHPAGSPARQKLLGRPERFGPRGAPATSSSRRLLLRPRRAPPQPFVRLSGSSARSLLARRVPARGPRSCATAEDVLVKVARGRVALEAVIQTETRH